MQKIGETGDGKFAVATPDGKTPKEEEERLCNTYSGCKCIGESCTCQALMCLYIR